MIPPALAKGSSPSFGLGVDSLGFFDFDVYLRFFRSGTFFYCFGFIEGGAASLAAFAACWASFVVGLVQTFFSVSAGLSSSFDSSKSARASFALAKFFKKSLALSPKAVTALFATVVSCS